jgi:hypothetical protein
MREEVLAEFDFTPPLDFEESLHTEFISDVLLDLLNALAKKYFQAEYCLSAVGTPGEEIPTGGGRIAGGNDRPLRPINLSRESLRNFKICLHSYSSVCWNQSKRSRRGDWSSSSSHSGQAFLQEHTDVNNSTDGCVLFLLHWLREPPNYAEGAEREKCRVVSPLHSLFVMHRREAIPIGEPTWFDSDYDHGVGG